jgi:chromosome segregation ATPase
MAEHGKGITDYKQQVKDLTAERDSLAGERDGLNEQLTNVNEKLGAFDGVDLEAQRLQVEKLQDDIKTMKGDYESKLADREFQAALDRAILTQKGRSQKAIRAELDLDALRKSKNQESDIGSAINALMESSSYLFDTTETSGCNPPPTPASVSSGGGHSEEGAGVLSGNAFMNQALRSKPS